MVTNHVTQSKTTFHLSIHIPISCNDKIKKTVMSIIFLEQTLSDKLLLTVIDRQKKTVTTYHLKFVEKIFWI